MTGHEKTLERRPGRASAHDGASKNEVDDIGVVRSRRLVQFASMKEDRGTRFPLGAAVRLDDLDRDPYPVLARLREDEPVSWVSETNMWFVTRRADVIRVLRDPHTFSTDSKHSTIQDIFGHHMMSTEGEEARRYKLRCLPTFRPASVRASHEIWLQATVSALIEPLATRGEGDLMSEVARPLAVRSVMKSLGLSPQLEFRIVDWYDAFAAALANFRRDPHVRARGKAAARAFAASVDPVLEQLREKPDGRLLSHMVRDPRDPFTTEEATANALIILFGGIETTESMIANSILALLGHQATWERLRHDPALRGGAIEETLRWSPAVQSCTRHTTRAVEIRGVTIQSGEVVQGMLGAANRDPACFTDPDRLDIDRPNASDHLGFGTGRHLCLGAPLARLETRVVLDALLDGPRPVGLHPHRPAHMRGYEFRKPADLWMVWDHPEG